MTGSLVEKIFVIEFDQNSLQDMWYKIDSLLCNWNVPEVLAINKGKKRHISKMFHTSVIICKK